MPITIDGLNNVVDVRNALSEHLQVVMSTNTVRRALHEACLGSSKNRTPLFTAKNVQYMFEFAERHQDWIYS